MRMDMDKEKKRIELYENKNQIVNAAIDRIVVELFHKKEEKEKGQAVLLTGCSPLAGTTSTCIGLAIAMANTKRKTLLVDCDVRKTIQYKKLNKEVSEGLANGNDVAVFTAMCMCWSGYLSTHVAMMDGLKFRELTGRAILCHTIGGLCAGIGAHLLYMILT